MIRFVTDRHLGCLAKWMRTLGYDTFFDADCEDQVLVQQSSLPGTTFVTTRKDIGERIAPLNTMVVPREKIADQLRFVLSRIEQDWRHSIFTRCVICNLPVVRIRKEQCADRIPARVFQAFEEFTMCPSCMRIYWRGSHTERLQENLGRLLDNEAPHDL